jgi:hypothetical protein
MGTLYRVPLDMSSSGCRSGRQGASRSEPGHYSSRMAATAAHLPWRENSGDPCFVMFYAARLTWP